MIVLPVLVNLVSLACWIMIIIKIFQDDKIGLGILAIICPLFAFIYGWTKANDYDAKNIMLVWTVCVVLSLVLNFAFHITLFPGR